MLKLIKLPLFVLFTCILLKGCATIDALHLLYGNKFASHSWLHEHRQSSIPIQILNQHTIIPVSVDGVQLRMILDTGAAATVLFETEKTKPFLSQLDTQITVGGMGEDDSTHAYFIRGAEVTIGSATISGLSTLFIKASDNPIFATPEVTYVDGVIGYDLFSRFTTEINFAEQVVRISEGANELEQNYQSLQLTLKNNVPYLDISIRDGQDTVTLPVMFDTGGLGSLLIDAGQTVPSGEHLYDTVASGMGGESPVIVNRLQTVAIGQYEIANTIAAISQGASSKTKNNIMGTGIINRFNLVVDYPSKQLLISPNHNFDKVETVNVFGAWLLPHTGGAYINAIRPGTPVLKLGLQVKDVVVTVNGDNVNYQNYDAYSEMLASLNSVEEICYRRNESTHCVPINL